MTNRKKYLYIYLSTVLLLIFIGGHLLEYAFAGLITLGSFILLIEASSTLKWIVAKCGFLMEFIIFCVGLYAKFHFGVTISFAFLFAGIGYSMLYAPYIKETYGKN